jgi:putative transposase
VVTSKRNKAAALKLLKRIMKKYGRPRTIVTDGLRAYSAAMREIGNADRQEVGVHAQVHNYFNQERHLVTRQVYKQRRSAALAEWGALVA